MTNEVNPEPNTPEAEIDKKVQPTENPLARGLSVTVSIPETVEIRMVDASVLADYEVWIFISSILSSAVIGFLVAYFQSASAPNGANGGTYLAVVAGVFAILFVVSLMMALSKRERIRKKSKDIKLRATEIVSTKDSPHS